MNKIYAIRDKVTSKFVSDSDLHGNGTSVILVNTPVILYFDSIQAAKARLVKMQKNMYDEGPDWDTDEESAMLEESEFEWVYMKPDPSRFEIVEVEVKVADTNHPRHYWRVKNTEINEYYKGLKKTTKIGKIYRTLSGAERVATAITKTPKRNRDTKAKKVLFGRPECANVELEPCILEYK
jgi:hypothetical protein